MPNQWNDLLDGLIQGGSAIGQGIIQKNVRNAAEEIYQDTMSQMKVLQEEWGKTYLQNQEILKMGQDELGGLMSPRQQIPIDYQGKIQDVLMESQAKLNNNPYGKAYADQIEKYWQSMQAPKIKYRFDPDGNIWAEEEGKPPVLWQESHKSKTALGEESYFSYTNDDGEEVYVKRYPRIDSSGRIIPGEYDEVPVSQQEYEIKTDTPQNKVDRQTDAIRDRKSFSSPRVSRKSTTPKLTKSETDDYNDIVSYGNMGKGWENKTYKQKQDYIKKEQELANRLFGGDVKRLQETKEKILNSDTKEGKMILKDGMKDPDKTKGDGVKDENKVKEIDTDSQIVNQKRQEYAKELKTQEQTQALDRVATWFEDVTGPDGWNRSDLTIEEWIGEIEQEKWNDIEWAILLREFYNATGEDLNKYFK